MGEKGTWVTRKCIVLESLLSDVDCDICACMTDISFLFSCMLSTDAAHLQVFPLIIRSSLLSFLLLHLLTNDVALN